MLLVTAASGHLAYSDLSFVSFLFPTPTYPFVAFTSYYLPYLTLPLTPYAVHTHNAQLHLYVFVNTLRTGDADLRF